MSSDNDSGFVSGPYIQGTPTNGTVAMSGTQITYTPNSTFTGTDSFTYIIHDEFGNSASAAAATVVVQPVVVATLRHQQHAQEHSDDVAFAINQAHRSM